MILFSPCHTSILDQKDLLVELFDDLEVVHDRMARVCGRMSMLAKVLNPSQLMLVMKATLRLMVQLNTTAAFLDTPASSCHRKEVPQNRGERVQLTMVPDPNAAELRMDHINIPN